MHFIYIIYSTKADRYYVGESADPRKRLIKHNAGDLKTYTGKHIDWQLKAVFEIDGSRAQAIAIEKFIKRQKSRVFLEKIIEHDFVPSGKLAALKRVEKVSKS